MDISQNWIVAECDVCIAIIILMYCNLRNNKFRKIILPQEVPYYGAPLLRKKSLTEDTSCVPGWERQWGPHGTNGKKFPMESWNYGYDDIGESFGGNRDTALRPAVVTAAKTLKPRWYCTHGTTYISSLTYIHTYTCMRIDISNFIIRMFGPERSDNQSEQKKMISLLSSRAIRDTRSWQFDMGRVARAINLDYTRSSQFICFRVVFFPNEEIAKIPAWLEKQIDRIFGWQYNWCWQASHVRL